jgi:hypothetical protein
MDGSFTRHTSCRQFELLGPSQHDKIKACFTALDESESGPSCLFAAKRRFGRFWRESGHKR